MLRGFGVPDILFTFFVFFVGAVTMFSSDVSEDDAPDEDSQENDLPEDTSGVEGTQSAMDLAVAVDPVSM